MKNPCRPSLNATGASAAFFAIITVGCHAVALHDGEAVKERKLSNFHQVNAGLYRGARPGADGVKKLAGMGIKTIVDLLPASHRDPAEEPAAASAGMRYINVPLSNIKRPALADVERVLEIINAPENQPVFIHCRRGADRTGTIIAAYRISREGWTAKAALREAKQYTMAWWQHWMRDFIRDFEKSRAAAPLEMPGH